MRKTKFDIREGSRRLKCLRNSSGLSHDSLSKKTGINSQSLKDYEVAGRSETEYIARFDSFGRMSVDNGVALARCFGVSVDYLLGLTPIETPDVDAKAAIAYTGLSEEAVNTIRDLSTKDSELVRILSEILGDKGMTKVLLRYIKFYLQKSRANTPLCDSFPEIDRNTFNNRLHKWSGITLDSASAAALFRHRAIDAFQDILSILYSRRHNTEENDEEYD